MSEGEAPPGWAGGHPGDWQFGICLRGLGGRRPTVETVLRMLLAELDLALALCGCTRPAEGSRDALAPAP